MSVFAKKDIINIKIIVYPNARKNFTRNKTKPIGIVRIALSPANYVLIPQLANNVTPDTGCLTKDVYVITGTYSQTILAAQPAPWATIGIIY